MDVILRLSDRQWSELNAVAATLRTGADREAFICTVARSLAQHGRPVRDGDIAAAINDVIGNRADA